MPPRPSESGLTHHITLDGPALPPGGVRAQTISFDDAGGVHSEIYPQGIGLPGDKVSL
jgi:hypothetical protein